MRQDRTRRRLDSVEDALRFVRELLPSGKDAEREAIAGLLLTALEGERFVHWRRPGGYCSTCQLEHTPYPPPGMGIFEAIGVTVIDGVPEPPCRFPTFLEELGVASIDEISEAQFEAEVDKVLAFLHPRPDLDAIRARARKIAAGRRG